MMLDIKRNDSHLEKGLASETWRTRLRLASTILADLVPIYNPGGRRRTYWELWAGMNFPRPLLRVLKVLIGQDVSAHSSNSALKNDEEENNLPSAIPLANDTVLVLEYWPPVLDSR